MQRILAAAALVLATSAGCKSGGTSAVAVTTDPVDLPQGVTDSERHLDDLLTDLVAGRVCQELRGKIQGLHASSSGDSGKQSGDRPVTGRLWIRECRVSLGEHQLHVEARGLGWRFIDKTSKKMGATFAVDEYARFAVDMRATGQVRASYEPGTRVAYLWVPVVEPLRVGVTPLGDIKVKEKGAWSEVLGAAADIVPMVSLEDQAKSKLAKKASSKLASKLDHGFSMVADLCEGLEDTEMGMLDEAQWEERNWRQEATKPPVTATVKLHPGGFDAAGPVGGDSEPMVATATVVEGGPVKLELACARHAHAAMDNWIRGQPVPDIETLAAGEAAPGSPARLEFIAGCRVIALTRPTSGTSRVELEIRSTSDTRPKSPECSRQTGSP